MAAEKKLLKTGSRKYREKDINEKFIQHTPTFCVAIGNDGKILMINDAMLKACGYKRHEVIGKDYLATFVPVEEQDLALQVFEKLKHKISTVNENTIFTKRGRRIFVEWHGAPVLNEKGEMEFHLGVGIDVSKRRQTEKALEASEQNYRNLVRSSLTGIYVEKRNTIIFANDKFAEIFGLSAEDLQGVQTLSLVHPDDTHLLEKGKRRIARKSNVPLEFEVRGVNGNKDGTWLIWKITPIQYKGGFAILGNVIDITERKKMETSLHESERKLRLLSSQLMSVQETVKSRISKELHDELGQALTFLKLEIGYLKNQLEPSQVSLAESCDTLRGYIDQVIETARRIARDLSPASIEQVDLSVALKGLVNAISKHFEVTCAISDDIDHCLSKDAEIAVYRVLQELLNNIVKHAQASHIYVSAGEKNGMVYCVVQDDGQGMDVEDAGTLVSYEKGLGLSIVVERVKTAGGTFDIHSQKGKGTKITFTLPTSSQG